MRTYDEDVSYVSSTRKSSSETTSKRSNNSADSAAEEMLRKCYKTNDVTDMLKEMNFTDPQQDSGGPTNSSRDSFVKSGETADQASRDDDSALGAVGGADTDVEKFIQ